MDGNATRRDLVRGGLGLAAASLTVGAASAVAATTPSSPTQGLSDALRIERSAAIAYRQVLGTDVLHPAVRSELRVHLAQELQHVAKLEQTLGQMGAAPPSGPTSLPAVQALLSQHGVHRSLTDLPTQHDCLRLLIDVESLAEGAYFAAIPALQDPMLVRICVEMMGADAQHWTLLSSFQHRGDVTMAVPYPFVAGSP